MTFRTLPDFFQFVLPANASPQRLAAQTDSPDLQLNGQMLEFSTLRGITYHLEHRADLSNWTLHSTHQNQEQA